MSVTRAKFLKSLGSSVTNYALGAGLVAADVLAGKMVAIANAGQPKPVPAPTPVTIPTEIRVVRSGPSHGNRIALTFDDGPTPGVTDRILDQLKQRGQQATFFMIGQRILAAPDLARRVLAEGHEIGNHTFTHPKLSTLPDLKVEEELDQTQEALSAELGYQARWFRPPYGDLRKNQEHLLLKRNLGMVLWNVDPSDWSQPGEEKIVESVVTQSAPGSVVVCHDMHSQTANCLSVMLDRLQEKGLRSTTISRLLASV